MEKISKLIFNKLIFCSASNKLKIYDGPPIILEKKQKKEKKETPKKSKKNQKNELTKDGEELKESPKEELKEDLKEIPKEELKEVLKEEDEEEAESKDNKQENNKKKTIKYGDKKKLAVEYTKYFLKKYEEQSLFDFFMNHKKKDDLADSYLQGLYYIKANKLA